MPYSQREYENPEDRMARVLEALERLRHFDGQPQEFWPAFLEAAAGLAQARFGFLLIRARDEKTWRTVSLWPAGGAGEVRRLGLGPLVEDVAVQSDAVGQAWAAPAASGDRMPAGIAAGVLLALEDEGRRSVAVFFAEGLDEDAAADLLVRLRLVADIPRAYQTHRMALQARHDVVQFAEALDLMVVLNAEKKFMAAAMALCNEVAARYRCQRVALGWLDGAYVRVRGHQPPRTV